MTCPVCHGPMPTHTALTTCAWTCALVRAGRFTLDQMRAVIA